MKKVLAFDLDDTLAVSKSPMSDRMAEIMGKLLERFDVCIISGARFEQFQKQVIEQADFSPMQLRRLHLMPTCGTRYYRFNEVAKDWEIQYAEDLTEDEKAKIIATLEASAKELGYWEAKPAGDIIEDRLSQITFSALGQQALSDDKYKWDADGSKKKALRDHVAERLPEFEVRAGGTTSIDITKPNIDKAYGIQRLIDILDISRDDILYFGDSMKEGGNDYPVKAMGIDSLEVNEWEDTAARLETIVAMVG